MYTCALLNSIVLLLNTNRILWNTIVLLMNTLPVCGLYLGFFLSDSSRLYPGLLVWVTGVFLTAAAEIVTFFGVLNFDTGENKTLKDEYFVLYYKIHVIV